MRKTMQPDKVSLGQQESKAQGFILLLIGVLLFSLVGRADRAEYCRVKNILVENKDMSVLHHHDWSADRKARKKIMNSWLGPFQPGNVYAFVECIDQVSGQFLFKVPSPALTFLWISDDSGYIVGLSDIKMDNQFQLVIFDKSGRLIKKRKIGSREAELTRDEYAHFAYQFPSVTGSLMSRDRIVVFHDRVYIDPQDMSPSGNVAGDAWDYLVKRTTHSHFSANFSESTMNWIHWYKEDSPEIRLRYEGKNLVGISLLDPKGQRFEIPVVEEYCR